MRLSVIIPCTRPLKVINALQAFCRQTGDMPFEVIVCGEKVEFDPGGSFRYVNIECDTSHVNLPRNKGIEHSTGVLVAFLDDDSIPCEGWLNRALSLDPDSNCLYSGPETAYIEQEGGQVINRIYQTVSKSFVEGAWGHFRTKHLRVSYSDLPFCNLVIPRKLLQSAVPLSTEIPWDMDDFHFCRGFLGRAEFWNDPGLRIIHDRYPSNIRSFLISRFLLRKRTGEKLISHTKYYGNFLSLWFAIFAPWLAVLVFILFPLFALSASLAFLLLWLTRTVLIHHDCNLRERLARFLLETALTAVTLVGYQCGVFTGIYKKLKALVQKVNTDKNIRA